MKKLCTSSTYRRTTVCSLFALLCLVVCPGCPGPALVGLAGYFLGVLSVTYQPDNGSAQRVSDSTGAARIHFNSDGCQPRVESYEGILPGFVESGTTQVQMDLERGTITGTVIMPEGEREDLLDILPGLRTQRSESEMGFELIYVDGELEYKYEVQFAMQNDACTSATEIDVEVVIRRRLTDGSEVLLDDSGSGTFEGEQQDEASRDVPLPPPLPPLVIDAGPSKSIATGGSAILEATVLSGGDFTVTWSPTTGLNDAAILRPIASPNATTTYLLTATDEVGQIAIDSVLITVQAESELPEPCESASCDDGVFCNGSEICNGRSCDLGPRPCDPDESCNEETNRCDPAVECIADSACDDGDSATTDTCVSGSCAHAPASPPTPECSVLPSSIRSNMTLTRGCYKAESDVEVRGGATLTIEAAVTVVFGEGTSLKVQRDGILTALGSAEEPVLFTGEQHRRGFWDGVAIYSNSVDNRLEYVTIEYGGGTDLAFAYGTTGDITANLVVGTGIFYEPASVTTSNCTLRESKGYGFYLTEGFTGALDTSAFANNTVTANALGAGFVLADKLGYLDAASTYTGNDSDAMVIDGHFRVQRAQTWPAIDVPFLIRNDVYVDSHLTIAPGATLKFAQDASLRVNKEGTLKAVGNAGAPITFTGAQAVRGFWDGVAIYSNSVDNRLEYVTIEYGGGTDLAFAYGTTGDITANLVVGTGIFYEPASVTTSNCTLRESKGYGFYLTEGFTGALDTSAFANNTVTANALGAGFVLADKLGYLDAASTYTGNDSDAMVIDGHFRVQRAQTWPAIDVPFLIRNDVYVDSHLTIAPGATLKFAQDASLRIDEGALTAVGTASAPIVFTGEQSLRGFWDGVAIYSNSVDNRLDHVTIEFAGGADLASGGGTSGIRANLVVGSGVSWEPASVTASNCMLRESLGYGMFLTRGGSANAGVDSANTFTGNTQGSVFRQP